MNKLSKTENIKDYCCVQWGTAQRLITETFAYLVLVIDRHRKLRLNHRFDEQHSQSCLSI